MRTKVITLLLVIAATVTSICYSRTGAPAGISENDVLKIEYINPTNGVVQVGNKKLKVGGKFTANKKIEWDVYGTKSIKARNLRTGEIIRFCSSNFKSCDAESLMEWYIKYHRTFDKGISSQEDKMADMLSQTHYMIDDTLFISSALEQNETNKFYVARPIRYSGTYIRPFPLEFDEETNQIAITKSYLQELGVDISQAPVTFSVEYHNEYTVTPLTDNMIIEYVPSRNRRK
jgi:hypothetical protein